ncbi:MAG: ATP-binding protein, partial [Pseudomonadota bacterium]
MLVTQPPGRAARRGAGKHSCPFENALDCLDAGALMLNAAGRITYVNARARSFYGLSDDPNAWTEHALGAELVTALQTVREQLKTKQEHAVEIARPNDAHVKLFAARATDGGVLVTLREAHPAVEPSAIEAAYRRVLERHGFGLWSYDAVAQDLWWSPRSYELIGMTPGTVNLTWIQDHVHPEDQQALSEAFARAYTEGEYAATFRATHEDDSVRHILDRGEVVARTEDGRPALIVGVTVDRTRLIALEEEANALHEQLKHVSQAGAAGQLAAAVAHDLNNALTVITCQASLLADRAQSEATKSNCEAMLQAAEYASDIAYRLLDFVRASPLALARSELGHFLADTEPLLRSIVPENIHFAIEPPASEIWADIDPRRMQQVLCNLVMNATQAVRPGGRIQVSVVGDREGVRIQVEDDGTGMAPDTLARIFEPLFTTRETGAGLGLASVRTVVERHSGEVTARSALGEGSTFVVSLPRKDPQAPTRQAQSAGTSAPRLATVWVVEDRPMLRLLVEGILRGHGHTVESFGDPREVLQRLDGGTAPPTLLLSDVVMPSMSGDALSEAVRERHPNVRAIYMSGYAAPLLQGHSKIPEGAISIPKPFSRQELVDAVEAALADGEYRELAP